MSISEELRELAYEAGIYSNARMKLLELADRIEAELVELPRDKDGVPIHVGDTVYTTFMDKINVARISILMDSFLVMCEYPNCETAFLNPYALTHERPDSLEHIANELEAWCDDVDVDGDASEKPRELADRIRKLAEKEGEQ